MVEGTSIWLMKSPHGEYSTRVKGCGTAASVPPGVPPRRTMMLLGWKRARQRVGVAVVDGEGVCESVLVGVPDVPSLEVAEEEGVGLTLGVNEPGGGGGGVCVADGVGGGVG